MEAGTSSGSQIKYCSIEERYLQEIEDLLVNGFVADEPTFRLCRNCEGGQPEDHRPWLRKAIRAHDWSVSRVAVDTATGRVAGVMVNDTATTNGSQAMAFMGQAGTEACRLVYGMVVQCEESYDVFKTLEATKVLYINLGVVDKKYRRQGISLELRRQSIELARQHGCQAAIDDASSPYTRKALTKLGFSVVRFLPYSEAALATASKVDMSECGPEDGIALMVCRL